MTPTPIFLLSLPRSGSTLVQRILARHPDVGTTPEPWLLLPQAYALRERGALTEYVQVSSARAIRAFAEGLPGGMEAYDEAIREMVLGLYDRAGEGRRYFLDKTPRYHLIVDDLVRWFPDARFVYLWRNPLAVAASIVETWAKGRWSIQRWHVDLYDGVEHLVAGSATAPSDRVQRWRFEDLVAAPDRSWPALFERLGLSFDPEYLEALDDSTLTGRMGDPTGQRRYRDLSSEPIDRWRSTFSTPVRKRWARSYLAWIGAERLDAMGYDLDTLLAELDAAPTEARGVLSDLAHGFGWWADRVGRARAAGLLWRRHPC
jgi:hypothetical protein